MKHGKPRNKEPLHVGAVLGGRALAETGRIDRDTWSRAVGVRVAARTRPGQLRDGTLTVYVASSVWAQELSFLTPEILERLRKAGIHAVEIRFRVAEVEPMEASRPAPVPRAPGALPDEISRRLANIGDAGLRTKLAEAAAYSLGKPAEPVISRRPATRAPRSVERGSDPKGRGRTPRSGGRKGTA